MLNLAKPKSNLPLLLIFALLIGSVLWLYVNRYLTQSKASQPKVNLTLVPKTATMPVGVQQTVALFIQPADVGNNLSGFDVTLTAQGNAKIVDVQTPTTAAGNDQALFTQVIKTVTSSTARVSYSIIKPSDQLPTTAKMNIIVAADTTGTGMITIDPTKTKVVGKISGFSYDLGTVDQGQYTFSASTTTVTPTHTVTVTPVPSITLTPTHTVTLTPSVTASVTPTHTVTMTPVPSSLTPTVAPSIVTPTTGVPAGNIRLNMKLRLQGVTHKPVVADDIPVKVSIASIQGGVDPIQANGMFSVDDQGLWSGSVGFNAKAGANYYVLVKGPKHLQKKVCVATPSETAPGTYRCANGAITLADGDNTLDLSGIYMLLGDLPDQDGVVDSYDISFIRNNLGSTDATALAIGDLNFDGRIDSQDYSLVIASLSVKKDEE